MEKIEERTEHVKVTLISRENLILVKMNGSSSSIYLGIFTDKCVLVPIFASRILDITTLHPNNNLTSTYIKVYVDVVSVGFFHTSPYIVS